MARVYRFTTHGSAKSGYDRQVRAIASQYKGAECSPETLRYNLQDDITKIKRANVAVASACYVVKIKDQYTSTERVEIWNEVIPGKERLVVTLDKEVANAV